MHDLKLHYHSQRPKPTNKKLHTNCDSLTPVKDVFVPSSSADLLRAYAIMTVLITTQQLTQYETLASTRPAMIVE